MWLEVSWGAFFLLLYSILILTICVRLLSQKRSVGVIFAWLVLLFAFPGFGVIAYLLIGEPKLGGERGTRKGEMLSFYREFSQNHLPDLNIHHATQLEAKQTGLSLLASRLSGFVPTNGNQMRLLNTTDSILDCMINDINHAQDSCLLEFYILEPVGRIEHLLKALIAASERGVTCKILVDDVGSHSFLKTSWIDILKQSGIPVVAALSVGIIKTWFVRSDLRNHRKLLIVDNQIGYTGSFNLVDPALFKQDSGVGQWVDLMMRCQGPVVEAMSAVFYADWAVENEGNLREVQDTILSYSQDEHKAKFLSTAATGNIPAQLIPSEPDETHHVIYETIICAIHAATERIIITTPYFVPDESLLLALRTAAMRGVDVTIIMPRKIDSLLVRYATRAYYDILLRDGVKLALFDGGLLHAKTLVVDNDYAIFGTVNMDMRSFFLNLEVSLAIYDATTVNQLVQQQDEYLMQSEYITQERWLQRPTLKVLFENIVRLFSPLL
ncbi:cardiolipin synthase [Pseudomonas sp. F1_0610]|uniref:cardiolipin synthase n=1 Tax=Pseudomonas sp. F1_0610 TaxID=3114284 RepID=UPI0039C2FE64